MSIVSLSLLLYLFALTAARPQLTHQHDQPFREAYKLRTRTTTPTNPLIIDLGYEVYEGITNTTTQINSWKGIRFAAPPTGLNRWQLPLAPETNRSQVILADTYPPQCPQNEISNGAPVATGITGNEDCLFLNVFAPANATKLPVLIWIHGGGYGKFNGQLDFTPILTANGNNFVGVSIQYRLGAFGFLSSQEVMDRGVVNAGLIDQYRALQWVQQYIEYFGGDPRQVTISGLSAGGGSVMLLDMLYGGTLGNKFFQYSIAASPYLATQHSYDGAQSTLFYSQFVERAGCATYSSSKFDCLLNASTEVLQNASSYVSGSGLFGTWAFLPVTDGILVQDLPSRQLAAKKVNGNRILTGNNAIEAAGFIPANITTEADVVAWLKLTYPTLTETDITALLTLYSIQDPQITAFSPRFATSGTHSPNANEVSPEATGQQQRAYNMYSESTFVCPSYWLAEAYTSPSTSAENNTAGYKYQYSVIPGTHAQDVTAYFLEHDALHSADFALAFKKIWGNFVTTGNPSISNLVANGVSTGNETVNPASEWPSFSPGEWKMVDLNETFASTVMADGQVFPGTGKGNQITVVDAYTWEAGRGARCEFWKYVGERVPG